MFILTAPLVTILGALLFYTLRNEMLISWQPGWRKTWSFSDPLRYRLEDFRSSLRRPAMLDRLSIAPDAPDRLDIFIHEDDWRSLSASLPASAYEWKDIRLLYGNDILPARLRLRGDYGIHFFHRKKSLKIRAPRDRLIRERRTLNLSAKRLFQQRFLYGLAEELDLLVPQVNFVHVFMNRNYYGTFLDIEETDESFLRRNRFMPGNIYNGENIENTVHRDLPMNLWENPAIWEKKANYNRHERTDLSEIARYLSILKIPDRADRWRLLNEKFDRDEIARYAAFVFFCNQVHMDMVHNLKYFVDPLSGVLHPIIWDPLMMLRDAQTETLRDVSQATLLHRPESLLHSFLEDPAFARQVTRYLAGILQSETIETALAEAEADFESRRRAFDLDALDNTAHHYATGVDTIPIISAMTAAHIAALDRGIRDVIVRWNRGTDSNGDLQLNFQAEGWSGVTLVSLALQTPPGSRSLELVGRPAGIQGYARTWILERAGDGNVWKPTEALTLGGALRREGRAMALVSANYQFTFLGSSDIRLLDPPYFTDFFDRQLGSDRLVQAEIGQVDPLDDSDFIPRPKPARIVLGPGKVQLLENLLVPKHTTLILKPGTRLSLGPGVSIACYGDLLAVGTAENPIEIGPADDHQPWGTMMLLGRGEDSRFRMEHCKVRGGSHATIDGVYFNGMVDVRFVADGLIQDCEFSANRFGDDCLHVSKSAMRVVRSRFTQTAADAIDFDYTDGLILDSVFVSTGNDAIDIMSSRVRIENCRFSDSGDKGVSAGEFSEVVIVGSVFENCLKGIELKDRTFGYVLDSEITGSREVGINAYSKNWRYGDGGFAEVWNCVFDNVNNFSADSRSSIQVYETKIRGSNRGGSRIVVFGTGDPDLLTGRHSPPSLMRETNLALARIPFGPAVVIQDDRFDEDFDTISDGWIGRARIESMRKSGHTLHVRSDAADLIVERSLAPGDPARSSNRVAEITIASPRGGELEATLAPAQTPGRTFALGLDRTGAFQTYRFALGPDDARIRLTMSSPRSSLAIKRFRILEVASP